MHARARFRERPALIVRILTARVPPKNVGRFNVLIRGELDELRGQPGLVYAKLARRLNESAGEEVVLFEEWRTPADLWSWTGGRLSQPRLLPGTEELVEELTIAHFEALDLDASGVDLTAITSATYPPNLVQHPSRVGASGEDEPGSG